MKIKIHFVQLTEYPRDIPWLCSYCLAIMPQEHQPSEYSVIEWMEWDGMVYTVVARKGWCEGGC